mmetsp:Transcript_17686/g.55155  ORF Transcript_17686/g.55155 Transcript_17686/m.55155 type:complete len:2040 (-) Transcript_17686:246-6365(-)
MAIGPWPRWMVLLVTCAAPLAVASTPGIQDNSNVTVRKHCTDIANDLWKVCKVSNQKVLCSQTCEAMLHTASVHDSICSNVVVSPSETYGETVASHNSFRSHYCVVERSEQAAVPAQPVDPQAALECFTREDHEDYRGHQNKTISGYTCQKWSSQTPHHHFHTPTEENSQQQGIGDHNYCRALSFDTCAWCYTVEAHPKWECCPVGSPQPSCPDVNTGAQALPMTLLGEHARLFQALVDGKCPRKLIMLKLVSMSAAARAQRLGWYEVVSEASKGIGESSTFLVAGHHSTLPGQNVADEMRGRLRVETDGHFHCTPAGLFFEPAEAQGGAGNRTGARASMRRVLINAPSVPEMNASIIELIEFKPVDREEGDASAGKGPPKKRWWEQRSMQYYVLVGLALYVGSLALCAILSYLIGRAGTPRDAGREGGGTRVSTRNTSRAQSRLHSRMHSKAPSRATSRPSSRAPSVHGSPRPGSRMRPPMWRDESRGSVLSKGPGERRATWQPSSSQTALHEPASQVLPIDQAINIRRVHDMAATTIQRQARERMGSTAHSSVADGDDIASDLGGGGAGLNGAPPPLHVRPRSGPRAVPLKHAGYGAGAGARRKGEPDSPPSDTSKPAPPSEVDDHGEGAVRMILAPWFRALGLAVARKPKTTIVLSLTFALFMTAGLAFMTFDADSYHLYLPQKSEMALMRKAYTDDFGELPDVIMIMVKRRAGGNVVNKATLASALALYNEISAITAINDLRSATDATGDVDEDEESAAASRTITIEDFCYKQFVPQMAGYVCAVESPLYLWKYSYKAINDDEDVQETVWQAIVNKTTDFGVVRRDDERHRVSTEAFMIQIFLNVSTPAYLDGRFHVWHRHLRERIPQIAQRESLAVTWWSTRLNEEEANEFVQKDAPLLACAFVFVIFYVGVTLSDFRCSDTEPTPGGGSGVRIMLSLSCALCSALSMSSGFGMTALLNVPISTVTPLVSFMLLGVSVDNMIIIVDTFDRQPEDEDVDVRLSRSIAESGTAITVTTFTTLVAFITGVVVDLPVYAYFCTTAACCVGCLYIFQLTLFCALLVIDSRARGMDVYEDETQYSEWEEEEVLYEEDEGMSLYDEPHGAPHHLAAPPPGAYAPGGPYGARCMARDPYLAPPPGAHGGPLGHTGCPSQHHHMHPANGGGYCAPPHPQAEGPAYGYTFGGPGGTPQRGGGGARAPRGAPPPDPPPSPPMDHNRSGTAAGPPELQLPSNAYSSRYDYANGYIIPDGDEDAVGGGAPPPAHERPGVSARAYNNMQHLDPLPPPMHALGGAGGRGNGMGGFSPEAYEPPPPKGGYRGRQGAGHRVSYGGGGGGPQGGAMYGGYQASAEYSVSDADEGLGGDADKGRLESCRNAMGSYARVLLKPWVRLLVVIAYMAPVAFALLRVHKLQPGLPYRLTVPAESIIMEFLDDVDEYYGGQFPIKIVMVFREVDPTDPYHTLAVRTALDRVLEQDSINRLASDWMTDYDTWTHCTAQDASQVDTDLRSICGISSYLNNTEWLTCEVHHDRAEADDHNASAATRRALGEWQTPWALDLELRSTLPPPALADPHPSHARRLQTASDAALDAALYSAEARMRPAPPLALAGDDDLPEEARRDSPGRGRRLRAGHTRHTHHRGHGHEEAGDSGDGDQGVDGAVESDGGGGDAEGHDKNDKPCVQKDEQFKRLSGGYACEEAVSRCESGTGFRVVRSYCPIACGLCTPTAEDVAIAAAAANSTVEHDNVETFPITGGRPHEFDVVLKPLVPGGCDMPAGFDHRECSISRSCIIGASRFVLSADLPQNMEHSFYVWQDLKAIIDDVTSETMGRLKGFIYHVRFEFGYFDHNVVRMGLSNLAVVVVVVALCTFCFLPAFISALAVFSVMCIDLQLLAVMSLVGLNFNSISCISLLIALGLAIDYSVHLGHAYNAAPFPTREEKVTHALMTMGSSIFNAGLSTLLGTLFLAVSNSMVFRTFFIFMWGTVFLGLFSGLVFAPVVLGTIGPIGAHAVAASEAGDDDNVDGASAKLSAPTQGGRNEQMH